MDFRRRAGGRCSCSCRGGVSCNENIFVPGNLCTSKSRPLFRYEAPQSLSCPPSRVKRTIGREAFRPTYTRWVMTTKREHKNKSCKHDAAGASLCIITRQTCLDNRTISEHDRSFTSLSHRRDGGRQDLTAGRACRKEGGKCQFPKKGSDVNKTTHDDRIKPIRSFFDIFLDQRTKLQCRKRCGFCVALAVPLPSVSHLGAAAGLGAQGLVPARAVHVVVAVPL